MASDEVTRLLERHRGGDAAALDELITAVYGELRRLAAYQMRAERGDHTLQPTALVHEAYERLVRQPGARWKDRAHFFAVAAQVMRHVLVDHARARNAGKRGGLKTHVALEAVLASAPAGDVDILALDAALERLSRLDPQIVRVVELRYFAGLTAGEAADTLGVSRSTVDRDWVAARAWLRKELLGPEAS